MNSISIVTLAAILTGCVFSNQNRRKQTTNNPKKQITSKLCELRLSLNIKDASKFYQLYGSPLGRERLKYEIAIAEFELSRELSLGLISEINKMLEPLHEEIPLFIPKKGVYYSKQTNREEEDLFLASHQESEISAFMKRVVKIFENYSSLKDLTYLPAYIKIVKSDQILYNEKKGLFDRISEILKMTEYKFDMLFDVWSNC